MTAPRADTQYSRSGRSMSARGGTQRIPIPSNSILASGATFERSNLSQTLIDILCLGSFALFLGSCAAALGIFAWLFINF